MSLSYWVREIGGCPVRARARRKLGKLLRRAEDCRSTQVAVLDRLLRLNADSRFSRDHGLRTGLTIDEFRRSISVSDYEQFRPYVDEVAGGNTGALLGERNKLLMFARTSGTTSKSKLIPITSQFLQDYRLGWQCWGIRVFDDHPGLHLRNIVQLNSDFEQDRTAAGWPCGNISGLVSAMQQGVVRTLFSLPQALLKVHDAEIRRYLVLRIGYADPNVGFVSTANPGTLVQMAETADVERETLIRDIHDGTLNRRFEFDGPARIRMARLLGRRNPRRARELERVIRTTGHLYPKDVWPQMQMVSVWTGGSASAFLGSLADYFGKTAIRDHGLSASEGRMTIPLADHDPSGVLDVATHFFEFIPVAEYGSDAPVVLLADELEVDQDYYILLTTSSGLYRYDICDVVRCTGFQGRTPLLRFMHKGANISNITGEKLSESHVISSVSAALASIGLTVGRYTLTPEWGEPPGYRLYFDGSAPPPQETLDRMSSGIERALQAENCEYREKRQSGRLNPVECRFVSHEIWQRFVMHRTERSGGSVEQFKHPCLVPDPGFDGLFQGELERAGGVPIVAGPDCQAADRAKTA